MKRFKIKSLSTILCLLILLTSATACTSSGSQTTGTTQAFTEATSELTTEKLTADFADGEYTLDDSSVSPHELLTALYRIAGEPEASRDFEVVWNVGEKDSYYHDATVWSAFQAGTVPFHAEIMATDGNDMPAKLGETFRVGGRTMDDIIRDTLEFFKNAYITKITPEMDFEADITRADVVLAMYYFVTTYVGKDVKDSEAAKSFDDFKKLVSLDSKIYRAYSSGVPETLNAWNWALDSGIVEAYSDNTLRPDATLTRAEFATMLTRFMDYVK